MTQNAREGHIRTVDHPELGRLELWAWPRPRGLIEWFKPREFFFEWRGVSGDVPFVIGVDLGVQPDAQLAFLDAPSRALIASLGAREPALRKEAARREIGLAREWSGNDGLSEEAFADALCRPEIAVYTDANGTLVDLTWQDSANIFAGHVLSADLDQSGNIVKTGLA